MIISEILTNPDSLTNFSYFGDTRDTINYLIWKRDVAKEANPEVITAMIDTLSERYKIFKQSYIKKQELRPDTELKAKRDAWAFQSDLASA